MSKPRSRRLIAFVVALLVAVIWGSVVQTQFNLAELTALGAPIDSDLRWSETGRDLLGFAPIYVVLALPALLVAFVVAALLSRARGSLRYVWFALGGFAGLIAAIKIVDSLVPPPVLIAATRGVSGLFAMAAGGALAGLLYAAMTRRWVAQKPQA